MGKPISGFSKLSKSKKIDWIVATYFSNNKNAAQILKQYWNTDEKLQQLHDEFIENTITNYYLPLGVAPNFLINDKLYTIPMAIEESSVVAAASKAAKFWMDKGGFKAKVLATTKIGQVHFNYNGSKDKLQQFFKDVKAKLIQACKPITKSMEARGGGIKDIVLVDKTDEIDTYFQLHATFDTQDAMGANFINSCLEQFAKSFYEEAQQYNVFTDKEKDIHIIMSILSNYVPDCLVRVEVSCSIEELQDDLEMDAKTFAEKFVQAVKIAEVEPYRAVTHNKGIMNGIDAVVLATGNDFRAVEAGVHAYASKSGRYSSLSHASVENNLFKFWMEVPLALGTVGGLTRLHPLVKLSLEMLNHPTAKDLMQLVATAGLAQNFAAIRSLITTGIQQGHMKMHLMNILNQFEASPEEKVVLAEVFKTQTVNNTNVLQALKDLRSLKNN